MAVFSARPKVDFQSFGNENMFTAGYKRDVALAQGGVSRRASASRSEIRSSNIAVQNGPVPKPAYFFERRERDGLLPNNYPAQIDLTALADRVNYENLRDLAYGIWEASDLPTLAHNIALAEGEISPLHSELPSRDMVELPVFGAYNHRREEAVYFKMPYVPANMKTVTDAEFARTYVQQGGVPALRYINSDLGRDERRLCAKHYGQQVIITIRTNEYEQQEAAHLYGLGARFFCIEMANAFSPQAMDTIRSLRKTCPEATLIAGNVASPAGYIFLSLLKVGAVKCGRGSGAACTTPEVTGQGVRQFTANWEMSLAQLLMNKWFGYDIPFWSDGGAKAGADIFKALWTGSGPVMMGSAFAAVAESAAHKELRNYVLPGGEKRQRGEAFYFGEASEHAARLDGREGQRTKAQGSARWIPVSGSLDKFVDGLNRTVRSAIADAGVKSAQELAVEGRYPSEFKFATEGANGEKNVRGENGEQHDFTPRLTLPDSW